jgi:hypothetical protein
MPRNSSKLQVRSRSSPGACGEVRQSFAVELLWLLPSYAVGGMSTFPTYEGEARSCGETSQVVPDAPAKID